MATPGKRRIEFERNAHGLKGAGPVCVKARQFTDGSNGPRGMVEIHGYGADEPSALLELLAEASAIDGFAAQVLGVACDSVPVSVLQRARVQSIDPHTRDLLTFALRGEL